MAFIGELEQAKRSGKPAGLFSRLAPEGGEGRACGFELLRIVAALLVIVAHSWAVCGIIAEPFVVWSGGFTHFGDVGVRLFFCLSGYLVSRSIFRSGSLRLFVLRRCLRIFPALFVALLLGLALAWLASPHGLWQFLRMPEAWEYLGRNLILDTRYHLPGVFAGQPDQAINGSLWSLPLEVTCYFLVAAAFVLTGSRPGPAFFLAFVLLYLVMTNEFQAFAEKMTQAHTRHAVICFALGAAVATYRDRLKINPGWMFAGALLAWLFTALPIKQFAFDAMILATVLIFERIRWAWAERLAGLGDPSYGMYVFAFPVQQIIVASLDKPDPISVLACTVPVVVAISYLSWHCLEKKALSWGRGPMLPDRPALA